MKKQNHVSLSVSSLLAAAAFVSSAEAADNPFGAKRLTAGYQLAPGRQEISHRQGDARQ